MTTNWMPIGVKMVQPALEYRPTNRRVSQVLAFPDTSDMVMVFVAQLRRPLGDNTNRRPMVVLPVDLVRLPLQQLLHMAMHQYTVDRRTIFGMQHSFLMEFKNIWNLMKFSVVMTFFIDIKWISRYFEHLKLKILIFKSHPFWCNKTIKMTQQVVSNKTYQLQQVVRVQRQFVVSILFCKWQNTKKMANVN